MDKEVELILNKCKGNLSDKVTLKVTRDVHNEGVFIVEMSCEGITLSHGISSEESKSKHFFKYFCSSAARAFGERVFLRENEDE